MQVQEHQESTRRQYGLRSRALALGWREEQIVVIDEDLGQSASEVGRVRAGYQRLLGEMVSGQVGAVLSVEISRLAAARQRRVWMSPLTPETEWPVSRRKST